MREREREREREGRKPASEASDRVLVPKLSRQHGVVRGGSRKRVGMRILRRMISKKTVLSVR